MLNNSHFNMLRKSVKVRSWFFDNFLEFISSDPRCTIECSHRFYIYFPVFYFRNICFQIRECQIRSMYNTPHAQNISCKESVKFCSQSTFLPLLALSPSVVRPVSFCFEISSRDNCFNVKTTASRRPSAPHFLQWLSARNTVFIYLSCPKNRAVMNLLSTEHLSREQEINQPEARNRQLIWCLNDVFHDNLCNCI